MFLSRNMENYPESILVTSFLERWIGYGIDKYDS